VEKDSQARQASMHHVMMLQQRYPHLLPTLAIHSYQHSLPNNITLLGAPNLARIGPIDLVFFGWLCQVLSHAGIDQGFSNPKSSLILELIHVMQHLQQ
jgi:site-specific DNA-cytosine methylase